MTIELGAAVGACGLMLVIIGWFVKHISNGRHVKIGEMEKLKEKVQWADVCESTHDGLKQRFDDADRFAEERHKNVCAKIDELKKIIKNK
jgi:hypothetical protein